MRFPAKVVTSSFNAMNPSEVLAASAANSSNLLMTDYSLERIPHACYFRCFSLLQNSFGLGCQRYYRGTGACVYSCLRSLCCPAARQPVATGRALCDTVSIGNHFQNHFRLRSPMLHFTCPSCHKLL